MEMEWTGKRGNCIIYLPIMENCKDLLIVWRENAKSRETLKVKIVARNTKDSSLPFKKKPQMLFAIFVPCLMAGAL